MGSLPRHPLPPSLVSVAESVKERESIVTSYLHTVMSFGAPEEEKGGGGKQLPERQSWRCRFGACFKLTMPGSSRNHPSS